MECGVRSFLIGFGITIFLSFGHTFAHAKTLTWSSNGEAAYRATTSNEYNSRSRFQKKLDGSAHALNTKDQLVALKYNSRTNRAWEKFNVRKVEGVSPSGREVNAVTIGSESCQCVGFIKEITGYTAGTSSWKPGAKVKPGNLPKRGTVIATFTNGKYNHLHTAVVVGMDGKGKWVEVIDQNWEAIVDTEFSDRYNYNNSDCQPFPGANKCCEWNSATAHKNKMKKGIVTRHRIDFSDTGFRNLANYHVVEVP